MTTPAHFPVRRNAGDRRRQDPGKQKISPELTLFEKVIRTRQGLVIEREYEDAAPANAPQPHHHRGRPDAIGIYPNDHGVKHDKVTINFLQQMATREKG